jgi:hypothetical protein
VRVADTYEKTESKLEQAALTSDLQSDHCEKENMQLRKRRFILRFSLYM